MACLGAIWSYFYGLLRDWLGLFFMACLELFLWLVKGPFCGLFRVVFRACLAGFRANLRGCLGLFCRHFICHIFP